MCLFSNREVPAAVRSAWQVNGARLSAFPGCLPSEGRSWRRPGRTRRPARWAPGACWPKGGASRSGLLSETRKERRHAVGGMLCQEPAPYGAEVVGGASGRALTATRSSPRSPLQQSSQSSRPLPLHPPKQVGGQRLGRIGMPQKYGRDLKYELLPKIVRRRISSSSTAR